MAKIRLLHLADTHLGIEKYGRLDPSTGLNSRLQDFLGCLDEAIEYALENAVDVAVFCGDAYRSRDPSPTYQREFARRIHRLARSGIQVFLLVGNHDVPLSFGRANTVEIFETLEIENITIGRKPGLHSIQTKNGPLQIVAMPWIVRSMVLAKEEYKNKTIEQVNEIIGGYVADWIEEFANRLDPAIPSILAAHLSVMGAVYGSEKSVMLGQDFVVPRSVVANHAFDYVALGHIHKHQVVSNSPLAIYSGSIERVDFGEENDEKGFVVVDLEKGAADYRFQTVKARRFVTIEISADSDDPTAQVIAAIGRHSLEGAVVRVFIKIAPDKEAKLDDAQVQQALKDAYCLAMVSRQVERKPRRSLPGGLVEEMTPLQALDAYLQARDYSAERRKLLGEYAGKLVSSGKQD